MNKRRWGVGSLVAVLVAATLVGCGSSSRPVGGGTGSVRIKVAWPEVNQRLIPTTAQAIRFDVLQAYSALPVATTLVVRPSAQATLVGVPQGPCTLVATAFPVADGTGTAVASAAQDFTVVAGASQDVSITLASTIATFTVTPNPADVQAGSTVTLTATAKDADGNLLMIPDVRWSVLTGPTAIALVTPRAPAESFSATVAGLATGQGSVQAAFTEAPGTVRTATADLLVSPPPRRGANFRLGETGVDAGVDVARDALGNVIVTGIFQGTVDFDPGIGTVTRTAAGSVTNPNAYDVFLAKYDDQNRLLWVVTFGGQNADAPATLLVDSAGYIFLTGFFNGSVDFNPLGFGTVRNGQNGRDAFLAKYAPTGVLQWVQTAGDREFFGAEGEEGLDVCLDRAGNVYWVGTFDGTIDLSGGAGGGGVLTSTFFSRDVFFASYESNGTFRWATGVGGTGRDLGAAIRVGSDGAIYVAGSFTQTADFDPDALVATNTTAAGGSDLFIAKYLPGTPGRTLSWLRTAGNTSDDQVRPGAMSINAQDQIAVAGDFVTALDLASTHLSAGGGSDGFVLVLDSSGAVRQGFALGGVGNDSVLRARFDAAGGLLLAGRFQGAVDFDPGLGISLLQSASTPPASDAFAARYSASGARVWACNVGGVVNSAYQQGAASGITFDDRGNVTVTGAFFGTADIDPGAGRVALTSLGVSDAFLFTLDPTGKLLP
jgi:hypothetical protein